MSESFLDGKVTLLSGDSAELIKGLPDNSIDSVVCDPPYALVSIVKRFGGANAAPAKGNDAYMRASAGFMGKQWDTGEVAFDPAFWTEVLRVLKPGGHLVAFSGTRTYHRMAVAIEDAGFEIRDQLQWLYGSGFPKSHDVSKSIDRAAGADREEGELRTNGRGAWNLKIDNHGQGQTGIGHADGSKKVFRDTLPATAAAREWQGWGTALKPASEPICLARKPLARGATVALNVLQHGVGALNIDGCRVGYEENDRVLKGGSYGGNRSAQRGDSMFGNGGADAPGYDYQMPIGRWPANVCHDGSEEVLAAFPETHARWQDGVGPSDSTGGIYGKFGERAVTPIHDNGGSAARFFYTAKADATDRLGSKHPTVKPLDLMQWLVRLVTPKGGTCLDPFAGTGTTGEAAWREGCKAILMEREPEYQQDIKKRMELANNPTLRDAAARSKRVLANLKESDTMALFGTEDA